MRRPRPLPPPGSVERWAALVEYDGPAREVIAQLKYRNRRAVVAWLAAGMAALVAGWADWAGAAPMVVTWAPTSPARARRRGFDQAGGAGAAPFVVTWAPTSPARARRRGFDQAELLARAIARRLDAPCAPLLARVPGPPQTGRSRAERARLPVFAAAVAGERAPPSVLLVDDVATTGATLAAAARALRGAGVHQVRAVVAGAAP